MTVTALAAATNIAKVDEGLGLVFGYAVVCKELTAVGEGGAQELVKHYDTQGHHIPEEVMVKAATDFSLSTQGASKDMHEGDVCQTAVFLFPMTEDIAKALDITIEKSGLLIGLKPTPEVLAKYKSGEYTGFSIGGVAFEMAEMAEAA
jgi:ABC-type branched-subunit amino acid transport system substrate-binding protein